MSKMIAGFQGTLIGPAHAEYETARRVWNGMIDRRPALVARCASAVDARAALAFARGEGWPIAIRGGAHNVAGNATVEGGVVIDLSRLKGLQLDRENARPLIFVLPVRAQQSGIGHGRSIARQPTTNGAAGIDSRFLV